MRSASEVSIVRLVPMFDRSTRTIPSSNGVEVVVYDEPGHGDARSHGARPPILFSHATGFHGRVFAPIAERLPSYPRITFDYRGFGATAAPPDWDLEWDGFGDDALAVARDSSERYDGAPVIGVGHSMGGAGLVMAALREPRHFAALVLFEPIIFPPEVREAAGRTNPLADVTRRRRRTFGSFDEAIANFSAKPPLSSLDSAALDAYVRHGFAQRDDGVHIRCDPEFEARTYEMGAQHDTWSRLPDLDVPTIVMAGAFAPNSPAAIAPRIHERLPRSTFVEWDDRGHFGPLEDPARFAAFVDQVARGITGV